jgi:hypothetical protein
VSDLLGRLDAMQATTELEDDLQAPDGRMFLASVAKNVFGVLRQAQDERI